jgi:hypothetical protein
MNLVHDLTLHWRNRRTPDAGDVIAAMELPRMVARSPTEFTNAQPFSPQ